MLFFSKMKALAGYKSKVKSQVSLCFVHADRCKFILKSRKKTLNTLLVCKQNRPEFLRSEMLLDA